MITFEVNDMTCGHCVSTITKAVVTVDDGAKVQADLTGHRVQIERTTATATVERLGNAIKEAGYTPVVIDGNASVPAATNRSGCCCGEPISPEDLMGSWKRTGRRAHLP